MSLARAGAALLAALLAALFSGCAGLAGSAPAPADRPAVKAPATPAASAAAASAAASGADRFALVTPQEFEQQSPTLGVKIEINAPGELKTLLDRHLDLVRLGRLAREDVDDTEWSRLIDAAPQQVRDLLQTEGYFAPTVSLERAPGRGAGQPDLVRLTVVPGTRARVSRFTLEAEGALERAAAAGDAGARTTLEQLRKTWQLQPGSDFRNPAWNAAKAAALTRLRAAGYANAAWSGTGAEVDVEHNEVRLFLVADSGPLFRYGALQIEGLATQDIDTVRHMVNAAPKAPVTEALLLDFQERLQKSGLFENISVTLDTDATRADEAKILVRLSEAPLQVYTFGVGVSANTGPRASVEHTYRRVFGYPAIMHNKVEYGAQRKAWDGELSSQPQAGLYRNLLGAAVEQLDSSTDTVLSQRIRLGRTQDTQRLERLYYLEEERSLRHTFDGVVHTKAIATSLNYHGVWRELDSIVLPTQGFSFSGQVGGGWSHGSDATSGPFARVYARLTGYLPVGQAWYGQARIEFGKVFLRSDMVVPESQQFRAGGDDSVRGYGYRSLGPVVDGSVGSGNVLATGSLELARPISNALPSLWGAVFVDAGNAGNSLRGLKPVVGTGVGLRWRSPVGPLRIDYAYGRSVHKARIHFSVGIAF
jgi:translocation and assembly module TamA